VLPPLPVDRVADDGRRADCLVLSELVAEIDNNRQQSNFRAGILSGTAVIAAMIPVLAAMFAER
jgi:hypothetical protein